MYDKTLALLGKPWVDSRHINLLTKKRIIRLCQEAGAKKITIKGNRFFGFVMDYIIIIE